MVTYCKLYYWFIGGGGRGSVQTISCSPMLIALPVHVTQVEVTFMSQIGAEGETRVCVRKDASLYPVYLQFRKMDKLSQNVDQSQ